MLYLRTMLKKQNISILILCLFISFLIAGVFYRFLQLQSLDNVVRTQKIYAERTESGINTIFHKTDVLAAAVKLQNGRISESDFNTVAKLVYQENSGIRGIQAMPGGVVTMSYPVAGNEAVMGKNFFDIPERRQDVLLAVQTKSIALSGPYHLIQGGLGVVARNPVFLTGADGKEHFWGFSAIVLDLPAAIANAGLDNLQADGYDYQLYCINENNERLVIEGNPDLDTTTCIRSDIQVPNHTWILAIKQLSPWRNLAEAGVLLLIGMLLSMIIWLQRSMVLQKEMDIMSKDTFLSDISHNMRTPINAIMGFSTLGQQPEITAGEKDTYLHKIQSSGKMLLDLVNDVLMITRTNHDRFSLHLRPISTAAIIDVAMEFVHSVALLKNISVQLDTDTHRIRTIMADRVNVQKILLSLLSNAVKYTPYGGHVWFTVHDEAVNQGHTVVVFTVRDDGIGISKDFLPHIYEPFSQEQRKGYENLGGGLGLSVVKNLVDIMGGTIAVDSKLGQGTTFTVRLPFEETASSPETTDETEVDRTAAANLQGKRVLVCEDNEMNREILEDILNRQGMKVSGAANGAVGVEQFLASDVGHFSAVLMDIRMPVMNGIEAAKRIRASQRPDAKTIPIIVVTADLLDVAARDYAETELNGYLPKPIDFNQLINVLSECVH